MLGAIFLDFCDVVLFPAYPFSQDSSLHLPSHTRYTSVSFPFTFAQSFLPAFLLFLLFIIFFFFSKHYYSFSLDFLLTFKKCSLFTVFLLSVGLQIPQLLGNFFQQLFSTGLLYVYSANSCFVSARLILQNLHFSHSHVHSQIRN